MSTLLGSGFVDPGVIVFDTEDGFITGSGITVS